MTDILKPVYGQVWATTGEKLSPDSTKVDRGWVQEMMPYQWENFLQNRQDVAITYILQKGIPEWSSDQEYIENKSVVSYGGQLYMATSTVTNVLPTVAASWKKMTVSFDSNGTIPIALGGTGAVTAADARTNLGIGTIALQAANAVSISGGVINSTPIGATTPSTGKFTNIEATGTLTASSIIGPVTGNASSATKLATPRTVSISGAVTGTPTNFDGSANIEIPITTLNVGAATVGVLAVNRGGTGVTTSTGTGANVQAVSPTLTGTPTAPTAAITINTTQLATTAFVQAVNTADTGSSATSVALKTARNFSITGGAIAEVKPFNGTADVVLDVTDLDMSKATAGTLAVAQGGTGVTTSTGSGATVRATSPTLDGTPTVPTAATDTNSLQIANMAAVQAVNSSDTGSAATALKLKTARTIGGVSFDGSANINLPGVNTTGYQSTTGSAATLTTARTINGTSFNGSANITTANWGTAQNITIGSTAKSVNGSADVSWTVAEIGAEPTLAAGTTSQYYHGDKTWQTLNKAAVGLSNVDNTADSAKPVSTAQQTALNLKANLASPALTGTPTAPTAADGTSTTQLATTAFVQGAVGGFLSKTTTGGTTTLTTAEASNPIIKVSGALTSNAILEIPVAAKRNYSIENATTGAFTLTVKHVGLTPSVLVAQGKRNIVMTNGVGAYNAINDFESIVLTGTPTAPTAGSTTNNTQVATTAFVQAVNSADTGSAATAVKLKTARTIGGVSFDGTSNINLPGVNIVGTQNTSGSAATLTTPRTFALSGAATGTATSFNGSANITIPVTALNGSNITAGDIPAERMSAFGVIKDSATGSASLPSGPTASRGAAAVGKIRHNIDSDTYEACYSTGWAPIGSQEQSIYAAVDYAKIRSYTGRGTRLRVVDPTGAHWWVRKGTAADNGGTVLIDALGRSWEREHTGKYNAQWWGCVSNDPSPSGLASNNYGIAAAINTLKGVGGILWFPAGMYHYSESINWTNSEDSVGMSNRLSIEGDGSGATILQWEGVGGEGVYAFKITGGVQSFQTISKIGFGGNSTNTIGLYLRDLAWARIEDVVCTRFGTGFRGENVLSFSAQNLVCRGNKFGAWFLPVAGGDFYSGPNAISLVDCDISLNSEWGLWVQRPGVFSIRGGAIQGNGQTGVNPDKWGVRVTDAGAEIGVGLVMAGVYLEANKGIADIFIEQYNFSASHVITASSVARIGEVYSTHCVRVDNAPAVKTKLTMLGCGFIPAGGYTPSSARQYLKVLNPSLGFELVELGTYGASGVEKHIINGRVVDEKSGRFASGNFNGVSGAIVATRNIASITKVATGVYDVVFAAAAADTNYSVYPNTQDNLSFWQINNKTTSGFRAVVNNYAGAIAGFSSLHFVVFEA